MIRPVDQVSFHSLAHAAAAIEARLAVFAAARKRKAERMF